jgi:hypothetical protein
MDGRFQPLDFARGPDVSPVIWPRWSVSMSNCRSAERTRRPSEAEASPFLHDSRSPSGVEGRAATNYFNRKVAKNRKE